MTNGEARTAADSRLHDELCGILNCGSISRWQACRVYLCFWHNSLVPTRIFGLYFDWQGTSLFCCEIVCFVIVSYISDLCTEGRSSPMIICMILLRHYLTIGHDLFHIFSGFLIYNHLAVRNHRAVLSSQGSVEQVSWICTSCCRIN